MNKPLKDRPFLCEDDELDESEDKNIEYKNYIYQEKIDEINRQYYGFFIQLRREYFFGINDLKIGKDIYLEYKTHDIIRNELVNNSYDFYP